tara:strand:+ start:519 stop:758 length:240 start_codon:yes stop_codon:yes gene_type:complete
MTRSSDDKTRDYSTMGDSITLINAIIGGSSMSDSSTEEKKNRVRRNYEHLEIMVAKSDWGSEDMTASNKAITDGKAYVG